MGGAWGMIAEAAADVGTSVYALDQARREARTNRDFQREMSNTSYQRAVADLRRAGLNPILAAKTGGASTPGGATAQIPNMPSVRGITSSAMQVKQMSESVKSQKLQNQQSEHRMEIEKEAMKYYRDNPDKQHALHEAIMAGLAGVRPEFGLFSGLWRQGRQGGEAASAKAIEYGEKMSRMIQGTWEGMKRRYRESHRPHRDGDIYINRKKPTRKE